MKYDDIKFSVLPAHKLGIIVHPSCAELGEEIDEYIVRWRKERWEKNQALDVIPEVPKDTFLLNAKCARFGTGEAKATIYDSVRGVDLYIIADVLNHSLTYTVSGHLNHMSPDDIFADIKRLIMAAAGKPQRITVVMPFLYESRQHKRTARESLDCAYALKELVNMGVDNILTFDAHDPRVMNAIPIDGFDNVMPTYQFVKALLRSTNDLVIDRNHLMAISPDEGAMQRAIYFASELGIDVGMFYKRRDYSQIVDGRNPIVAHEFLGDTVLGKDVLIIDDMISSGESMIDVARGLKERGASRVFCLATFGIFTKGPGPFDEAYEEGIIEKVITTDCTYLDPEVANREWYVSCGVTKYIALLIDSLNHDISISEILDPSERINQRLQEYREFHTIQSEYADARD